MRNNVKTLHLQGNPTPEQAIYEYFNDPLDRAEAQRAAWLDYRRRIDEPDIPASLDRRNITDVAARAGQET